MANFEQLDRQIEPASSELKAILGRLEGYAWLQSSLDVAGSSLQRGGAENRGERRDVSGDAEGGDRGAARSPGAAWSGCCQF